MSSEAPWGLSVCGWMRCLHCPLPSCPADPPTPALGSCARPRGARRLQKPGLRVGRSNGRALTIHSGVPLGLLLPALIQLISGLPPEGPSLTLVQGGSALGPQNSHGPKGRGIGAAGGHSGCGLGVLGKQSGASLVHCDEPCNLGRAEDWETGWAAPKGQGCACGSPSPGDHPPRGRGQGLQNGLLPGARTPLASGLPIVPTAAAGSLHGPLAHLLLVRY